MFVHHTELQYQLQNGRNQKYPNLSFFEKSDNLYESFWKTLFKQLATHIENIVALPKPPFFVVLASFILDWLSWCLLLIVHVYTCSCKTKLFRIDVPTNEILEHVIVILGNGMDIAHS